MSKLMSLIKNLKSQKDDKKDEKIQDKQGFIGLDVTTHDDFKLKIRTTSRKSLFITSKKNKKSDLKEYNHFSYYDRDIISTLDKVLVKPVDDKDEKKTKIQIRDEFLEKLKKILKEIIKDEGISGVILQKIYDSSHFFDENKTRIMHIAMVETMLRSIAFVGLHDIKINPSIQSIAISSFVNLCSNKINSADIDDLIEKPEFNSVKLLSIDSFDPKLYKMFFFYNSLDAFMNFFSNDKSKNLIEIESPDTRAKDLEFAMCNALKEIIMPNKFHFNITAGTEACKKDIMKFTNQIQAVCQVKNTVFVGI